MSDTSWGLLGLLAVIILILWAIASHKNNGEKLGIGLIFLLLFGGEALAGVTLNLPGFVNQGGFFKVVIQDSLARQGTYNVIFLRKEFAAYRVDEKTHAVTIPVDVLTPPGRRFISVELGDSEIFRGSIEIKQVNFPKSAKIFKRPPYTKAQLARLKKEQKMLDDIYSNETQKRFFNSDLIFARPFGSEAERVSSEFGSIRKVKVGRNLKIYTVRHYGVDYPVPEGTLVFAAEDGIVRFAGDLLDAGNTVIIDHGYGLFSTYMHLSKISVRSGDLVRMGWLIAYSGKTGNATGPNLHFGVKLHNVWVDPKYFFGGAR